MPASRLVRQVSAPRNLFGRLVAQGGFYTAGLQLGSGAVVLPVICAHQGLTWAAGLLYPAFCIGAILGNSLSPLILQRAGQLRHLLMAAISATAAALVVCNAAVPWTGVGVAAVFLATTGAGGVVTGVSSVAYTDMIPACCPRYGGASYCSPKVPRGRCWPPASHW
ncbi:integral membrane protein [Mycobacterium tuberculosis]|nr:integral membrane protein [Mycobacterium tuberculosis]